MYALSFDETISFSDVDAEFAINAMFYFGCKDSQ